MVFSTFKFQLSNSYYSRSFVQFSLSIKLRLTLRVFISCWILAATFPWCLGAVNNSINQRTTAKMAVVKPKKWSHKMVTLMQRLGLIKSAQAGEFIISLSTIMVKSKQSIYKIPIFKMVAEYLLHVILCSHFRTVYSVL